MAAVAAVRAAEPRSVRAKRASLKPSSLLPTFPASMFLDSMLLGFRFRVLPSASPRSGHRLASSREHHPAVHRRGAPLTSAAGFDPHRVCRPLDNIAQTNRFIGNETRQSYPVGLRLRLVSRSGSFVLHTAPPNISLSFEPWTLPGNLPRRSATVARSRSAAVLQPASRRTSLAQR